MYRIQESANNLLEIWRKEGGAVIIFKACRQLRHGVADLLRYVGHVPDGTKEHPHNLRECLLVHHCWRVDELKYPAYRQSRQISKQAELHLACTCKPVAYVLGLLQVHKQVGAQRS